MSAPRKETTTTPQENDVFRLTPENLAQLTRTERRLAIYSATLVFLYLWTNARSRTQGFEIVQENPWILILLRVIPVLGMALLSYYTAKTTQILILKQIRGENYAEMSSKLDKCRLHSYIVSTGLLVAAAAEILMEIERDSPKKSLFLYAVGARIASLTVFFFATALDNRGEMYRRWISLIFGILIYLPILCVAVLVATKWAEQGSPRNLLVTFEIIATGSLVFSSLNALNGQDANGFSRGAAVVGATCLALSICSKIILGRSYLNLYPGVISAKNLKFVWHFLSYAGYLAIAHSSVYLNRPSLESSYKKDDRNQQTQLGKKTK